MAFIAFFLSLYSLLIIKHIRPELFWVQAGWLMLGFAVFFIIRRIRSEVFRFLWPIFYILSVFLLIAVFLGPEVRGTHRWLEIASWRLQPAELVKPLIIVSMAGFLAGRVSFHLRDFLYYVALFLPIILLIFKEPDLGNALVFLFVFIILIVGSPFTIRYYIFPLIVAVISIPFLWNHLAKYQQLRFITFFNPTYDVQGAGYHALQSLIAVGSGGLFGRGLGAGTQSSLRFLPEFHTDFIFASTAEQLGFAGGMILILFYVLLLISVIRKGKGGDSFRRLLCLGVFAQLFFHVFVNIGMNMALLPITGITLPLFSFGGSSILSTFISLAIIAGSKTQKDEAIAIR